MKVNPETDGFFYCLACNEADHGATKTIRTMPAGKLPAVPCEACGGVEFGEFAELFRPDIVERLGPDNLHGARLFFCRRCRVDGVQFLWGAAKLVPCDCGSRYFDEIIGAARVEWLRKHKGA